jgi:septal ring factor EnvC (AmiA/AmiB activator)
MLQTVMLISLGFLTAAFIALAAAPVFWRRTVERTTRHIRARSPLTMSEIQADRDQMRAEFAVETRKLEIALQQNKDLAAEQRVAVSAHAERIAKLDAQLKEKDRLLAEKDAKFEELGQRFDDLKKKRPKKPGKLAVPAIPGAAEPVAAPAPAPAPAPASVAAGRVEPVFEMSHPEPAPPKVIDEITDDLDGLLEELAQAEQRFDKINQPSKAKARSKMKRTAHEAERARLLADITDLEQKIAVAGRKLEREDKAWQQQANPFAALIDRLDVLTGKSVALAGQLAKSGGKDANGAGKNSDGSGKSNGAEAPEEDTKPGPPGAAPSLVERIRALQKQVTP